MITNATSCLHKCTPLSSTRDVRVRSGKHAFLHLTRLLCNTACFLPIEYGLASTADFFNIMKRAAETPVIDLTAATDDVVPPKKRKSVKANKNDKDDLEALREEWRTLYAETLPKAARGKDPAQPKWCVELVV